jgi:predicted nuclease of predicted toxin-antitoxin system
MKFLIDAQIPNKLALFLRWKGFDALHTSELPEKNRTKDSEINRISIEEQRILISKDLDFIESLLISDKPYKLIYITTGNISNKQLMELFSKHMDQIIHAVENGRLIELSIDQIVIRL